MMTSGCGAATATIRWRVEGCLRRLRHRHDGVIHRAPLLNSSKQAQETVGGYFKDPTGTSKKVGSSLAGTGENFILTRDHMPKLKDQLQRATRQMSEFEKLKSHIEMTVTTDGLCIELSESATWTFFDSGSAKLNKLSIEGHTDSAALLRVGEQCVWELSTGLANATRRLMQGNRIRADQVAQVRGFADQQLRKPEAPLDSANLRISLIAQYVVKNREEDERHEVTIRKQQD